MSKKVDNFSERVLDLINMGKAIGLPPTDWAAILSVASETIQKTNNFKIDVSLVEISPSDQLCPCEKCKAGRAEEKIKGGLHVIN